ncbi:MAG: hypothetical protein AB8B49_05865 [Nitratireductor sp.]
MATPSVANAQPLKSNVPLDSVQTFNEICYKRVPDVEGINNMALDLGWRPLAENDLVAFGDIASLKSLKGWDVKIGKRFYRLGLTQGAVIGKIKSSFPEFANGTTTSCTLILDGGETNAQIAQDVRTLAGKEPASTNVDEGTLLTTTFAGGNADFKVFLFNKASKVEDGGLLNVTVVSKN